MAKNSNNKTFYLQDENFEAWEALKEKSQFINWCLKKHLKEGFYPAGLLTRFDDIRVIIDELPTTELKEEIVVKMDDLFKELKTLRNSLTFVNLGSPRTSGQL